MATGDLLSASIETSGWVLVLTFEGMSTGGTMATGIGANGDLSNAKATLAVTDEGYTNAILGTKNRTIKNTEDTNTDALRLAYPNQAVPDIQASGSDIVVKLPLNQAIHDDTTNVLLTLGSALYNDGSNDSAGATSFSVTNNSTLDYPRVLGNSLITQKPVVTGDFVFECLLGQGYMEDSALVDCVKLTVTDEHSNSVNYTLTTLEKSDNTRDYNQVLCYKQSIDVSSFTSGDMLTIQYVGYPHIGDADSILNSNDGVNSFPTPLYTNMEEKLYKNYEFGHCVVDLINGSDGTGTVYATQALAESAYVSDNTTAYATVPAALTAMQAYHNTNYSRNHAGGGWLYLVAGTYEIDTSNGGVSTEWTTITRYSGATKAQVVVTDDGGSAKLPHFARLYDITVDLNYYFIGSNTRHFWVDYCDMNCKSSVSNFFGSPYMSFTHNTGTMGDPGLDPYTQSQNHNIGLIRGNEFDVRTPCRGYTMVGNKNLTFAERGDIGIPANDNIVWAFNETYSDADVSEFTLGQELDNISHGALIIQSLFVRYGTQLQPIINIGGVADIITTNHIVMINMQFVGSRGNFGYDSNTTLGPCLHKNWFRKNIIFSDENNKTDVFGENPLAVGNWSVRYGVNSQNNHFRTSKDDEWFGDFLGENYQKGTRATPLEPGYVEDNSADGNDTSGGDYHLASSSPIKSFSNNRYLPFDLEGNARSATGDDIGVYAASAPSEGGGNDGWGAKRWGSNRWNETRSRWQ